MLSIILLIILLVIMIVACLITAFALGQKYPLGIKLVIFGGFLIFLISPILTFGAVMIAPYLTMDPWGNMGLALGIFLYAEVFSIGVTILGLVVFLGKKFLNSTSIQNNPD